MLFVQSNVPLFLNLVSKISKNIKGISQHSHCHQHSDGETGKLFFFLFGLKEVKFKIKSLKIQYPRCISL